MQNLIDSAAQRSANRTVQCPIFLAEELARCTFQTQHVKAFVKLYRQRVTLNAALNMPQRMEEAIVRLMQLDKVCLKAKQLLAESVVRHTWENGPCGTHHILSAVFCVGSCLNDSCVIEWASLNIQSASGQVLALEVGKTKCGQVRKCELAMTRGSFC